jgi:lysophospholipase L1-like esterase
MKKIICFGDSNTFGFNPVNRERYDITLRWTGVLSGLLQKEFQIIEEGCNNRTAFFDNPDGVLQSGQIYLGKCLEKHSDFDIFILALGTNDLQKIFQINENIVKTGLKNLVLKIKEVNNKAKIILIPPVILGEDVLQGGFNHQFDKTSIDNSIWVQKLYKDFALLENCEFLDLNKHVSPSQLDGLHFCELSHSVIAKSLAEKILKVTQKMV